MYLDKRARKTCALELMEKETCAGVEMTCDEEGPVVSESGKENTYLLNKHLEKIAYAKIFNFFFAKKTYLYDSHVGSVRHIHITLHTLL